MSNNSPAKNWEGVSVGECSQDTAGSSARERAVDGSNASPFPFSLISPIDRTNFSLIAVYKALNCGLWACYTWVFGLFAKVKTQLPIETFCGPNMSVKSRS